MTGDIKAADYQKHSIPFLKDLALVQSIKKRKKWIPASAQMVFSIHKPTWILLCPFHLGLNQYTKFQAQYRGLWVLFRPVICFLECPILCIQPVVCSSSYFWFFDLFGFLSFRSMPQTDHSSVLFLHTSFQNLPYSQWLQALVVPCFLWCPASQAQGTFCRKLGSMAGLVHHGQFCNSVDSFTKCLLVYSCNLCPGA